MRFSENWLRSLVAIDATREALVERLTMAGLEVESLAAMGEGLDGIVVGEILAAEPHPSADRLRVCRVGTGAGEPLTIVCGAPNARAGLRAPLAREGTRLPDGRAIGRAELRGVASQGMLCSAAELGLDDDASGLLELPGDAPPGAPLAGVLGLPDASIELKLTPNRPDCLGMRGLAAEVATLFETTPRIAAIEPVVAGCEARREVRLEAPADGPRYLGRVIEGIDPAARTPRWMIERLRGAGLRPISAVVDCTNYVMLELGQPMHAFDHDRLDGAIAVRRARDGERLTLLDGREVRLDGEFLVIADARGAVALAGIMGGADSRVTDATRNLFLESAHFAPTAISGRARRLGMHTDASHRFERGVDAELPRAALERLSALLLEVVGGRAGPVVEAVSQADLPRCPTVVLRRDRLARVLGLAIADARVETILAGLGMRVEAQADGWRVTPPSRRFDVAIEEDLIEEVVRVHGYDHVPTRIPGGLLPVPEATESRVERGSLRRLLCARGYHETINFAFVPQGLLARWGADAGAVALANPLSADLAVMRTALLPGLIESLRRNRARQEPRVRLFELGRVFRAGGEGGAPIETARLAAVACGSADAEQWGRARRPLDFHDLKGDLEAIAALAGGDALRFVAEAGPAWHPGRSARVLREGREIGRLGLLHPGLAQALDLDGDVHALELDLEPLCARQVPRAARVSPFPSIRRDISFEVDRTVAYAAVEASVRKAAGAALRAVVLFDEYAGPALKADLRSLSIGLILQDDYRTLTHDEAESCVSAVVDALDRDFGARLRS